MRGTAGRRGSARRRSRSRRGRAAADSAYAAFENRFRGSREEIRERLAAYVELLRRAAAPVVDLGCGRGEFLELLRERGVEAPGASRATPTRCASAARRGLDVVEGDLVEFLRAQAGGSPRAASSPAQVAEHLPPAGAPVAMLAEAHRALRPGGLLLLETVNPRSVTGFLEVFNRDLTHERPLHPDTLRFLAAAAGFADVRVEMRSPVSSRQPGCRPCPRTACPQPAAAVPQRERRAPERAALRLASSTRSSRGAEARAPRLRLAPPARATGIADYAAEVLALLAGRPRDRASSTPRTRSRPRRLPAGVPAPPAPRSSWPRTRERPFDLAVYQMGNGRAHDFLYDVLSRGCPACSCSTTSCCTTRGPRSSSSPSRCARGGATPRAPRRARRPGPSLDAWRSELEYSYPGRGRAALRGPPRHGRATCCPTPTRSSASRSRPRGRSRSTTTSWPMRSAPRCPGPRSRSCRCRRRPWPSPPRRCARCARGSASRPTTWSSACSAC